MWEPTIGVVGKICKLLPIFHFILETVQELKYDDYYRWLM